MQVVLFNLLGLTSLVLLIILSSLKSLSKIKLAFVLILISIFPYIVYSIPILTIKSLVIELAKDNNRQYGNFIGLLLLNIIIIVVYIILIIDTNIFMNSGVSEKNSIDYKIDKGIKINNLGIFFMIINCLYGVITAFSAVGIGIALAFFSSLPGVVIFTVPIGVIIYTILVSIVVFLLLINYIYIFNGTIRLIIAIKMSKKERIQYVILMIIPIANIFSSIRINKVAKKILKDNGYNVGLNGVKLAASMNNIT